MLYLFSDGYQQRGVKERAEKQDISREQPREGALLFPLHSQ